MKAGRYLQDEEHYSEDGNTVCWKSWTGDYWVHTVNRKVAGIISFWKGIEEKGMGKSSFYALFLVLPKKIGCVIRVAKLPPRKKTGTEK